MTECSPTVMGACTGHYLVRDFWGPAGTGLIVAAGLGLGMVAGRFIGLRGWSDWLKIWAGVLVVGGFARLQGTVGSNWLIACSLPGLYVCTWRILRLRLPDENP